MFKTLLVVTFLVGSAIADLKDFPDRDALLLAQEHNISLLEPSKQLYGDILKELSDIKKAFPAVAHIHHNPDLEPGKVICNKAIDLDKVNNTLGPIKVEQISNDEHLITFSKPYDSFRIIGLLPNQFSKPNTNFIECRSVRVVGVGHNIKRGDLKDSGDKYDPDSLFYFFIENSKDCFVECRKTHSWSFQMHNGTFVLEYEDFEDLDKRITLLPKSTTQRF